MSNDNKKYPYRTDWQKFKTCCLDISLFNRYQEGTYLASMYKWVSERFDYCIINLGDGLHRHNMKHEFSEMLLAHKAANALGQQWINDNAPYIEFMSIPYQVLRSDYWLAHEAFTATHEALWEYYYGNQAFKQVVSGDVEGFVRRRRDLPVDIIRQSSLCYLLEETAADIILGRETGVAHLYPGARHDCYGYLVEKSDSLPDILRGLENSAFKRLSPSRISLSNKEIQSAFLKRKAS